jgi:Cu-Zn family superoxide dismutase
MLYPFELPDAVAHICGGPLAPDIHGVVEFYNKRPGVLVVARIHGLPDTNPTGFFALHIHEGKSCRGRAFATTGGHYNPASRQHPMHAGDLPPLLRCDDQAYLQVLTNRFTLEEILGRTVVIHSRPDDFRSQPSGDAGEKIACGVIMPKSS